MAPRQGYCQPEELLHGKINLPRGVDHESIIAQAANEMDSYLGRRYAIPVSVDPAIPEERSDALFLANINAQLATGRLITSAAAGGENDSVHSYGRMLLSTALKALKDIADGKIDLRSAAPVDEIASNQSAPKIYTRDRESFVDSFYNNTGGVWSPGGMRGDAEPWRTFP